MSLASLFRKTPEADSAERLYSAVVAQARRPEFYARLGVPDTVDGRFELIALHAFLVLRRLRADGEAVAAQALFDRMFDDMDRSLREMGAGDLGVGRRVKAMAQAFYGRIVAYGAGLDHDGAKLADALRRNLYATAPPDPARLDAMAAYLRDAALLLDHGDPARRLSGAVAFPAQVAL